MSRVYAVLLLGVLVLCSMVVMALDMRLKARERACVHESVQASRYCHPTYELAPSWSGK